MKRFLFFILLSLWFTSCQFYPKEPRVYDFEEIKKSDLKLLSGIEIEARHSRDSILLAPLFVKHLNNIGYTLPNFAFYGCDFTDYECLEKSTRVKFDIIEFADANDIEKEKEKEFVSSYSKKVIDEYQKLDIFRITSNPEIGECIIFYFDTQDFLIYATDVNKINNQYWRKELSILHEIEKNWYTNNLSRLDVNSD